MRIHKFSTSFNIPIFSHMSSIELSPDFDRNDISQPAIYRLASQENNQLHVISLPVHVMNGDNRLTAEMEKVIANSINFFNLDPTKVLFLQNHLKSKIEAQTDTEVSKALNPANELSIGDMTIIAGLFQDIATNHNKEFEEMPLQYRIDYLKSTLLANFEADTLNPNVVLLLNQLLSDRRLNKRPIIFGGMPELLFRSLVSLYINANTVLSDYKALLRSLKSQYSDAGLLNASNTLTLNNISKLQIYSNGRLFRNNYSYELAKHMMKETNNDVVIITDPESKNDLLDLDATKSILQGTPLDADEIADKHKRYERLVGRLLSPDNAKLYLQSKHSMERDKWNFSNNFVDKYLTGTFKGISKVRDLRHFGAKKHLEMVFNMAMFEAAFDTQLLNSAEIDNKFFFLAKDETTLTRLETENLQKKFYVAYQLIQKEKQSIIEGTDNKADTNNLNQLEKLIGVA